MINVKNTRLRSTPRPTTTLSPVAYAREGPHASEPESLLHQPAFARVRPLRADPACDVEERGVGVPDFGQASDRARAARTGALACSIARD